jgi:TolA-binding protein
MMSKQKIFLIVIAVLFIISLGINVLRFAPETKNYKNYEEGLRKYNNSNYSDAYASFGRISRFSKLKSAAVFRQALCADKLKDSRTEIKKYKEVIRNYSDSPLGLRARYLKAQEYYESKRLNKAQREFTKILDKYSKTDYATASEYYLGSIEAINAKTTKNNKKCLKIKLKAGEYFKIYLRKAPDGKFALNCINKWLSLGYKLTNEDYFLIAKIYQENKDYNHAQKYLNYTSFNISWSYFVKNAYAAKNYAKVRYYTEQGLKSYGSDEILINESLDEKDEKESIYKAIDDYLKISDTPRLSISYLLSIASNATGHSYLLYKNCTNLPVSEQTACFNSLYYKYPNGQFAAEALANIFYGKVKTQQYFMAKKLGKTHLLKFKNTKSAPKVMFWLAKTAERTKNYEEARSYYRTLIKEFPDDYYAYHAFLNLNRYRYFDILSLKQKPVKFPYNKSNYKLLTELVKVKDYGLINQLYKDDDFVQSWLDYQQGDFANSARIARDAMDKLGTKPNRFDLRWRLVYPIHYYDVIKQNAIYKDNDPNLILAIIREESYFNPNAQSPVGAIGLMQLMPSTALEAARKGGIIIPNNKLLFDPDINIKLGNIYYAELKKSLLNRDILAVLAYNGGIGSVFRWKENLNYYDVDDFIEQIPYPETQNYLKKVYRSYWNYLRIYDGIKF